MSPPDQDQLVDVRQRRYVVTEVQKTVLPSNPLIQVLSKALQPRSA
ncbi:MAG: hypothetical protein HC833_01635 [Leptolyngbyaceae cyanobacterium RM1_406_9]|nr:hypothetical protein [Leptolyngbyaceae cyanobacterium RM1_406_9]